MLPGKLLPPWEVLALVPRVTPLASTLDTEPQRMPGSLLPVAVPISPLLQFLFYSLTPYLTLLCVPILRHLCPLRHACGPSTCTFVGGCLRVLLVSGVLQGYIGKSHPTPNSSIHGMEPLCRSVPRKPEAVVLCGV